MVKLAYVEVQDEVSQPPASFVDKPWMMLLGFTLVTSLLAILDGGMHGDMFTLPDTDAYLQMARGQGSLVPQPFSMRQLGPLLAGGLHQWMQVDLSTAYIVQGIVALLLLVAVVGFMLVRSKVSTWWLVAVGGLSFWATLFNGLVLADLLFASLLGVFAYLLYKKHTLAAALMLFPLELTRESTALVLLCFLLAGWRRITWWQGATAVAAMFAGMQIVKAMIAAGLSNHDQLSFPAYMAGKLVWNSLYNVFGLPMWTNVSMNTHCVVPQWKFAAHLGGIRQVGFCGWDPAQILCTLRTALGCFGLLPLLLLHERKAWTARTLDNALLIRFCVIYGVSCFLLAAELGPSIARLFDYSWPVFLIATPLLASGIALSQKTAVGLMAIHLSVSWLGWIVGYQQQGLAVEALLLLIIVAGYASGSWLLGSTGRLPHSASLPQG